MDFLPAPFWECETVEQGVARVSKWVAAMRLKPQIPLAAEFLKSKGKKSQENGLAVRLCDKLQPSFLLALTFCFPALLLS